MDIDGYEPGTFCWADLATTDVKDAKKFYTNILGLDSVDMPMGDMGGAYMMLQKEGKMVCAMFQMPPDMMEAMPHPHWRTYISVEDADEGAKRAAELGGNVLMGAMDVFDAGRTSMIQDTTGAAVGLWQPKAHIGAQVFGEPGALGWFELLTGDTEEASKFYAGLLGWTTHSGAATPDTGYLEFRNGEWPAAGMMQIQPEWGEVPPNWGVYFVVEDADGTMKRAEEMGATGMMGPIDVKGVGRIYPMKDPQGAYLSIIEMVSEECEIRE